VILNGIPHTSLGVTVLAQQGRFLSGTDDTTIQIPGRDGATWLRSAQQPRDFQTILVAEAASLASLVVLCDRVAAWLVGDGSRTTPGPVQLVFDDELPDRAWTARCTGGLTQVAANKSLRVRADLTFTADDPHPYALVDDQATLTSSGMVVRTKGNCPSEPLVEVKGVLTSAQTVTLALWGRQVQITGPLATGQTMSLDLKEGTYRLLAADGSDAALLTGRLSLASRGVLFGRDRAICPPGGGPVSWTTTGIVTQVRVECRSRWL
jgi:phage-related protein